MSKKYLLRVEFDESDAHQRENVMTFSPNLKTFIEIRKDEVFASMPLDIARQYIIEQDDKNMTLANTASLMVSSDFKERFQAEYLQLKNRYESLTSMIKKWDNGTLKFTPTCPRATYDLQLEYMKKYKDILEMRAKMEDIKL